MPIPWSPNVDTTDPDSLNDWYERQVGYRPQEDDPEMTDTELRALVRSYIEALHEEGDE